MINPFVGAHLQRVVAVDLLGEVEGVQFQSIELTLEADLSFGRGGRTDYSCFCYAVAAEDAAR